ncbi:hypothetical protein ACFYVL_27905 [Streptomyces sp. NPDC004111]|uniref:hypothetical protein n=1 Tax=Streptomyces sp. NPDC004111 TaxID=3364690 RepID=UPI0036B453E4
MSTAQQATPSEGARLVLAPHLGYWFEMLMQGSTPGSLPEARALEMLPFAKDAIRTIRIQIRTFHMLGMNPREIGRAAEWANFGWIQALAALDRGEPCGFSLLLSSGQSAEWHVTPKDCFPLYGTVPCMDQVRSLRLELSR